MLTKLFHAQIPEVLLMIEVLKRLIKMAIDNN